MPDAYRAAASYKPAPALAASGSAPLSRRTSAGSLAGASLAVAQQAQQAREEKMSLAQRALDPGLPYPVLPPPRPTGLRACLSALLPARTTPRCAFSMAALALAALAALTLLGQALAFQPGMSSAGGAAAARPRLVEPRAARKGWQAQHELYVKEAAAAREAGGVEVVLYGDSITERWRGTSEAGRRMPKLAALPALFQRHFGGVRTLVFGLGGDSTPHLLWRVINGEGAAGLGARAAVVLIGTNDYTEYYPDASRPLPEGAGNATAAGVVAVAAALRRQAPGLALILVGLLPRGDAKPGGKGASFHLPSRFTRAILATNRALRQYAEGAEGVHFVDCGGAFLAARPDGSARLRQDLMPDGLHPGLEGMEELARCIAAPLERAVGRSLAPPPPALAPPREDDAGGQAAHAGQA